MIVRSRMTSLTQETTTPYFVWQQMARTRKTSAFAASDQKGCQRVRSMNEGLREPQHRILFETSLVLRSEDISNIHRTSRWNKQMLQPSPSAQAHHTFHRTANASDDVSPREGTAPAYWELQVKSPVPLPRHSNDLPPSHA